MRASAAARGTAPGRRWGGLFAQALLLTMLAWVGWHVLDWAVLKAEVRPDVEACKALMHQGACWGVVAEKWPLWVFGRYPAEHRGQATAALALWAVALGLAVHPLWRARPMVPGQPAPPPARLGLPLLLAGAFWGLGLAFLAGGWAGLAPVESRLWGGLPLTLLLTVASLTLSLPLALLLAWGRLSPRAWLSWPCALFIEVVRGAPLVMWLFMAAFVLPIVVPDTLLGPVGRVLAVSTLFSAAYAAETLRGGLRVVAGEQAEAARMLGADWWTSQRTVIVPQALRTALPSLVNHTIGLLKDTALVMIVSLQDLTGAMSVSLNGDPQWRPFFLEAYLVIALAYALLCLGVALLGRRLEALYPAVGHQQ